MHQKDNNEYDLRSGNISETKTHQARPKRRISRYSEMWCRDGIEIDWFDSIEELRSIEDADNVTGDETAHRVAGNGEP